MGVDRIAEADRRQQRAYLDAAIEGVRGELAGVILEVVSTLRPLMPVLLEAGWESRLAESSAPLQDAADRSDLIEGIGFGIIHPDGTRAFLTLDRHDGRFHKANWPGESPSPSGTIRGGLRGEVSGPPLGIPGFIFAEGKPVLVLPQVAPPPREADGPSPLLRLSRIRGDFQRPPQPTTWLFLVLDSEFLLGDFLPSLVERRLRPPALSAYRVAVIAGEPPRVLFSTEPEPAEAWIEAFDFRTALFDFPSSLPRRRERVLSRPPIEAPRVHRPSPDDWVLIGRHEAGSLDAAVDGIRHRNLAIGLGMLVLLAGSTVSFAVAVHREKSLARQRMNFVAGVTHELRTPLSILQSAGFNLTERLANDSQRVREYGELIQRESRRLSRMLEQILGLAGIQSGRRPYEFRILDMREVVCQVHADYAGLLEDAGFEVSREMEKGVLPVRGDVTAIQSAVKNLLDNVLRYAAEGKWIHIGVRRVRNEVQVTVRDRGPGIDRRDLPHLFKPFYRGESLLASSVRGAGLGLSLVYEYMRAHGGHVTVDSSSPGKGATFILHFRAARERSAASDVGNTTPSTSQPGLG